MAKCLLHVLYVATDRRALSQLLLLHALYHNIIRAIGGVSHTACKDELRQIFDHTAAGVYLYFYNI